MVGSTQMKGNPEEGAPLSWKQSRNSFGWDGWEVPTVLTGPWETASCKLYVRFSKVKY